MRQATVGSPQDAGLDGDPPPIERERLLARLMGGSPTRIAVLGAPAGSGKSTVLRQWSRMDPRPVAWLSISNAHADPFLFIEAMAQVVADRVPQGPVADTLTSEWTRDAFRNQVRLSRALSAQAPMLVVLDDLQRIGHARTTMEAVIEIIDRLPGAWTVAIAHRSELDLPIARWRLAEASVSIGYRDLVLDTDECQRLLRLLGVRVTDELVEEVLARTEGWPAGVYLAGLALCADRPLPDGTLLAGDHALVRSYLDSEVLADIAPADRSVLVATSILDEIPAGAAEALTGDARAWERLVRVARSNTLVEFADEQGEVVRCHSLLRERLRRDLDGQSLAAAHDRVSRWYTAVGRPRDGVTHAFESGDLDRAAQLVADVLQDEYRAGRTDTVMGWLGQLYPDAMGRNQGLALAAVMLTAVEGDTDACTRFTRLAGLAGLATADHQPPVVHPDGLDPWFLRALLAADGPEQMLADVRRSLAQHDQAWRWRSVAMAVLGTAHTMLDDGAAAAAAYDETERLPDIEFANVRLYVRAQVAIREMDGRGWAAADRTLGQDRRAMLGGLGDGGLSGTIWWCADARLSLHRGDVRGAKERLARAQQGRTRLSWAVPWYAVRCLTVMAQAQLLSGDPSGARASLSQAREVIRARPRLGGFVRAVEEMHALARQAPDGPHGASTLSPAELRLLPLLATYLSFKEIGMRLGISANTVKTEAMSIYAKVGATSRSEAIDRSVASGLLDDPFA